MGLLPMNSGFQYNKKIERNFINETNFLRVILLNFKDEAWYNDIRLENLG